ncbi:hypothetical protein GOV11_00285 [Candidatus Woesearchaeota archaeon]|nr:hypothetical protein [Candidatus Woesearchaeota archaeon]
MSNKKWKYFLKTVSGDPEPEIGWYNFQTLVKGAGINTVSLAGGNYNPPGKKNVPESGCLADAKDKLKMFNLDVLIRQDAIYSNVMPE